MLEEGDIINLPKKLLKAIKAGNVRKFYKSSIWQAIRKQVLIRDNHECQKCKEKGKFSKADCVHHIKHLREFPLLALVLSNLISLCNSCHNEEHPEKLKKYRAGQEEYITEERW
ncbi:HNH endonuclease [Orenia marismortui]|uniref:Putative HNH nuclease YajD n=1 Tax=Orenia marismortui TaxID=46469 RepID=A0A4R8GZG9_9FIRM|nr:HNH endonuclease [Orenia marismortui]TDX52151.1 HNH endonuclease [Orenia marismortui]